MSYHVRTLRRLGFIKLVRTRQVRGTIEHYYDLVAPPRVSAQTWSDLPELVKGAMTGASLTQVADVIRQWYANGNAAWKIPLLRCVVEKGGFTGKRSTPWSPDSLHDFMHAKVTVCDDTVFLGSFNLSRSGEMNAENVLEIHDERLADRLAGFVEGVRERYPAMAID